MKTNLKSEIAELLSSFPTEDLEENFRLMNLKEIEKEKKILESKLQLINKKLEQSSMFEEPKALRPNLQIEKYRKEYFEEEKKKSEENAKKTKEYYLEQKRRQKKIEKHIEKLNQEMQEEQIVKLQKQKEFNQKFEELHSHELKKIKEQAKRRKQELEEIKLRQHESLDQKKEKPLYKKIEEKYLQEYESKELERRKAELAKIRQNFQPISKQDIIEHIRKHDNIIKEREKPLLTPSFDTSNYRSKFTEEILKQDKQKKIEEEKVYKERMQRIENRLMYGESIRELYSPTVDKFKQLELALRLEKLKNPVIKKKYDYQRSTAAQSDSEIKVNRKMKANDQLRTKNLSKAIDYLAEKRKKRKFVELENDYSDVDWEKEVTDEVSDTEKAKILHKKANFIEKKAKIAELGLSSTIPDKLKNIKNVEKLDSMLISSIKAKLVALNYI